MQAIQIKHVTKRYRDITALDDVSVTFEYGKIYGLLGRNGAGKSTLMNILANRIFACEGTIHIDDINAKENMLVQEKIHCMSETDLYDMSLKIKDQFKWINRFYHNFQIDKAYQLADMFGLPLNKRFKGLSKGYQSIFKLIVALSLDVPYVIFDEPVLGLDANHREMFYTLLLKDFEEKQRTIILATHLIEEVATLIEEVVIIDEGKILLQDHTESILNAGYSVAGSIKEVDAYCKGKNVIGYDELQNLKIAYILGDASAFSQTGSLHMSTMNLQKLFVKITEKGGLSYA